MDATRRVNMQAVEAVEDDKLTGPGEFDLLEVAAGSPREGHQGGGCYRTPSHIED
ncbi:MAG TPA: hypothetical protein VFS75_02705 [Candidatus Paceibacterota bacterium]|nr:hypothetical protein [Candidatus Paceibacterota bacterium]